MHKRYTISTSIILASVVLLTSVSACEPSSEDTSVSVTSTTDRHFGHLPNGSTIAGAPDEAALSSAKAASDEVFVENLRGMTLAGAMRRLGPLDRIATTATTGTYQSTPVVRAVPKDQPHFSTALSLPWDQLTITAAVAVGDTFYFGVIPTVDLPLVPHLSDMLKERAPITAATSKYIPLWYQTRGALIDQVDSLSGDQLMNQAISVVVPHNAGR